MKCLIVDDNSHEAELLAHFVGQHSGLELIDIIDNVIQAYAFIREQQPPLLFLDINMPLSNGIELFEKVSFYRPICVFVSSHGEYAIDSYDAWAFDFMLKPVTADRFDRCIRRVLEYGAIRQRADLFEAMFEPKSILVKEGASNVRIMLSDILYIEALNNYSKLVTRKGNFLTLSKLKYFMEMLPEQEFIRVNRSYVVARQFVEKMTGNHILVGGEELPIGKTYRTHIRKLLTGN